MRSEKHHEKKSMDFSVGSAYKNPTIEAEVDDYTSMSMNNSVIIESANTKLRNNSVHMGSGIRGVTQGSVNVKNSWNVIKGDEGRRIKNNLNASKFTTQNDLEKE